MEFLVLQFVPIASCPFTGNYWEAALSFYILNQLFLVCKYKVQWSASPCHLLNHLC